MAVKQELPSFQTVIPLVKLDLDCAHRVQFKKTAIVTLHSGKKKTS